LEVLNMADQDQGSNRRRSGVLDAIFDAVEEKPAEAPRAGSSLFRVQALEQIDIPTQLDNLLPITSRRLWISMIAVVLVLAGGLVYAGGVTQISSVEGNGRVVQTSGIAVAAAPTDLLLISLQVTEGQNVKPGEILGTGVVPSGDQVSILAPLAGSVWQILGTVGRVSPVGTAVLSILPVGSSTNVLMALPESQTMGLAVGQIAQVSSSQGVRAGTVISVASAPVPVAVAEERIGDKFSNDVPMIMVDISLDEELEPGTSVAVTIIESEQTLLNQLVNVG
jgi:hypothetical protein